MKSLKKILLVTFFLLSASFVFADDWFVCAGSYSTTVNASEAVQNLQRKGISSFIYEFTKDNGTKLYRVLIDEAFTSRDACRNYRDSLEKSAEIKALRLSGLWICQAKAPEAVVALPDAPVISEPEPVVVDELPSAIEEPEVTTEISKEPVKEAAPDEDPAYALKIKLEWNDQSVDLDAHMVNLFSHVYWDEPKADGLLLKFDEEADYAPESIYLLDGVRAGEKYSYYVEDYDNCLEAESSVLSNSGATVKLFIDGECVSTYSITPNLVGTTWHVFDIIDGNIITINEVNNEAIE